MGGTRTSGARSEASRVRGYAPAVAERTDPSPLADALARVGDRWTLLLIGALIEGPKRFNDLVEDVAGIAPNILTQRLRHLEHEALVVARPYSERPPRMVYELSAAGLELASALRLLADWGARHSDAAEPARHGVCGTPLEVRWYCPTCGRTVDEGEADELEYI